MSKFKKEIPLCLIRDLFFSIFDSRLTQQGYSSTAKSRWGLTSVFDWNVLYLLLLPWAKAGGRAAFFFGNYDDKCARERQSRSTRSPIEAARPYLPTKQEHLSSYHPFSNSFTRIFYYSCRQSLLLLVSSAKSDLLEQRRLPCLQAAFRLFVSS